MNENINRTYYYTLLAAALLALVVPIWLVELPPLVDLPNHLARVFILAHYAATPFFQQNFQIVYEPFPNLAVDLIVAPLTNVFGIFTANHLFLTLTVVLFAVGCHLLGARKKGERSFSAVPAMFLIYGGTFFYGYVNYVFGIALFLVTFGLWLRWRDRLNLARFLVLAALALAAYLAHLSAIGFLGIAIVYVDAYDFFARGGEKRRWIFLAADCALFVIPAIAFLAFINGTGDVGVLQWNTFGGKAIALFGPFRSYDLWIDLLCAALLGLFCSGAKRFGGAFFDWRILSLAFFFFAVFLLAPNFFFTGDADVRIVLPAFVLLAASCKVDKLSGKTFAVFAVLFCLLIFRQGAVSYRWIQISEQMTAEANLLNAVTPESKIFPIYVNDETGDAEKLERPIINAVHYATLKNGSFAASLFAFRGEQPLVFRRADNFATLENEDKTKWMRYLDQNDYVWAHGVPQTISDELEKRARLVAENGKTKIWKINK